MREIVFDTETTGFDVDEGDRLVEIGCVELMNKIPTGRHYHQYVNPEREMSRGAYEVHGLSTEFLSKYPIFGEVAEAFLEFVDDAALIAHNASFDMKFINWELENVGLKPIPAARSVDTLAIARAKFPGAQNSLDALCRRLGVDNSNRDLHGALLDAQLLAEVYLELMGGRQQGLALQQAARAVTAPTERKAREPRPHAPSEAEAAAHEAFVATLADPIWSRGT